MMHEGIDTIPHTIDAIANPEVVFGSRFDSQIGFPHSGQFPPTSIPVSS